MRRISKKTAARKFREQLKREVGHCELCRYDPSGMKYGEPLRAMHQHEIARGPFRDKARDKRYAVLWLCCSCHQLRIHGNEDWPQSRQLAVLKKSRPKDYDLDAFNALIGWGPDRITAADVAAWKGEK
jgi:hypothetical protein